MKHTLSVLVEDKPGALSRISNLFARRGYNIESLAVGQTEREGVSRITLRVDCAEHSLEQITKQIYKLVNVLRITELTLFTVAAPTEQRGELMAFADHYGARVSDLGPKEIVFEMVGHPEDLDSFEELVRPYGIKEMVRTGRIGLSRAVRH
jgi:acetolactate synthase-1/3 small subunit